MCRKLHVMSSSRWGFLDEPFDSHINLCKMSVLGLDYMLRNLKAGGDRLEFKDDVCNSEWAVVVEEDLESLDLVEVGKIHLALSLSSGLLI